MAGCRWPLQRASRETERWDSFAANRGLLTSGFGNKGSPFPPRRRESRCQHQLLRGAQSPGALLQDGSGVRQVHRDWKKVRNAWISFVVSASAVPVFSWGSRSRRLARFAERRSVELVADRRWFCHVDDDNYVNMRALVKLLSLYAHTQDVYIGKPSLDRPIEATERLGDNKMRPVNFWFATGGAGFCVSRGLALKMSPWASGGHFMNTAERIRLPDDCTVGYIVESVLGVRLIRSNLFHSHLENLQQVSTTELHKQVTLSYGMFENKRNIINVKGAFSLEEDPSRFKSVHCLLYPDTPWCPSQVAY
ncbi:hypothetical protein Z043_105446 [Scleropages formosus]|uniref:Fringe-like glycosyltransferase domain-containing protein n=1 Tax=Scleropages formosus TaxID=113540 RepID=A0A0P7Z3Z1_SCLFO|nr:hypothetical protein Z043_105446 [Scleropages formosus]